MFSQDFTCPDLLDVVHFTIFSLTGLSPPMVSLSRLLLLKWCRLIQRAVPISLAATFGISIDFFSSGYLDVSVLQVCLTILCIQIVIPYK